MMNMPKNTTINDIAQALNLSRNTVSKVFNNGTGISQAVRDSVIQKAIELNYKNMAIMVNANNEIVTTNGHFLLLYHENFTDIRYWGDVIVGVEEFMAQKKYSLLLSAIKVTQIQQRQFPQAINNKDVQGIICVEIYDTDYLDILQQCNLPIVSIDATPQYSGNHHMDIVLPESYDSVFAITKHLISTGAHRIGFIGDINHCTSFNERFSGYYNALLHYGIPFLREHCIMVPNSNPYCDQDWMYKTLQDMTILPDAFVCANDPLAMTVYLAAKRLGVAVPDEMQITGFDDLPFDSVTTPILSTIKVDKREIGYSAASLLHNRIQSPNMPFSILHNRSFPVLRSTTK